MSGTARPARPDAAIILASLELAAERGGDITAPVYARLFAAHPDMQALFVRDKNGQVRGEMLTRVLEAVIDFAGSDSYASNFTRCEVVTHAAYGVPPAIFPAFFAALRDTLRALLDEDWDARTDAAWAQLLAALRDLVETTPVPA